MLISTKHLQMVAVLAKADTLTQAAKALHMTQSALSHQLKSLEAMLGCQVVQRKSKPVQLTREGERLRQSAEDVLQRLEKLHQDLDNIKQGKLGRLHISIECHSCYLWLLPTLDSYRSAWPDIELDLLTGYHFNALPALKNHELDLVITSDPDPIEGISYIPLFRYESVLAVPNRSAWLDRGFIEPEDLADATLICYPMSRERLDIFRLFLSPAQVEPAKIRHSELTVMMMQLVASGRGVSGLPNWAAEEFTRKNYVQTVRLGPSGVFSTLYAAVREAELETPYLSEFLLLAKDMPFNHLVGIEPLR